jgi:hypothetical protein
MLAQLVCLLLAVPSTGNTKERPEEYVVAREVDNSGRVTFGVMTRDQFQEALGRVRREGLLFQKALLLASREWSKDETRGSKPFPVTSIVKREIDLVGRTSKSRDESKIYADTFQKQHAAAEKNENTKMAALQKKDPVYFLKRKKLADDAQALFAQKLQELLSAAPVEPPAHAP